MCTTTRFIKKRLTYTTANVNLEGLRRLKITVSKNLKKLKLILVYKIKKKKAIKMIYS